MKKLLSPFFFFFALHVCLAQTAKKVDTVESLKEQLAHAKNDTNKVLILYKLSQIGGNDALDYGQKGLSLAEQINYTKGRILCGSRVGILLGFQQKKVKAIELLLKTNQLCEKTNDRYNQAQVFRYLGYFYEGRQEKKTYYLKSRKISEQLKIPEVDNPINGLLAYYYKDQGMLDSALYYNQKTYSLVLAAKHHNYISQCIKIFGQVYSKMGKYDLSLDYFRQANAYRKQYNVGGESAEIDWEMARVFKAQGQLDSAQNYAQRALILAQKENSTSNILPAATILFELNQTKNPAEALKYHLIATAARDTMFSVEKTRQIEQLTYEERSRQENIQQEKEKALQAQQLIAVKQKAEIEKLKSEAEKKQLAENIVQAELVSKVEKAQIQATANQQQLVQQTKIGALNQDIEQQKRTRQLLFAGLVMIALVASGLFYNNRQKQRVNSVLQRQKAEIDQQAHRLQTQKEELQQSLTQLQSTQNQLIQKEKLASLGELTAGIAHEIQNPLNFVNNFSELSVDLANELKEEAEKPDIDKELIIDLATDLAQNQSKINLHGKRASSIVSGMLEHSRTSTGERTLIDINKLAHEYLRLAYHGLRAKDNSFNSDYQTDFDVNIPKIEVISQDMGRVLLNLINNAFWAVKTVEKPLVVVKTKQIDNEIIIKVSDNGTGMSEATKAKIFQPFFTTKPTGQGTGLGLSLAYDIVTKGHGGKIEVVSNEGVGSEFIIQLNIL